MKSLEAKASRLFCFRALAARVRAPSLRDRDRDRDRVRSPRPRPGDSAAETESEPDPARVESEADSEPEPEAYFDFDSDSEAERLAQERLCDEAQRLRQVAANELRRQPQHGETLSRSPAARRTRGALRPP